MPVEVAPTTEDGRVSLGEVIKAFVPPFEPSRYYRGAELLLQRMMPHPIIIRDPVADERLSQGSTLVMVWPHFSLLEIPIVSALVQNGFDVPTRTLVAHMPTLITIPDAMPLYLQGSDLQNQSHPHMFLNRVNMVGYFLAALLSGDMGKAKDEKSSLNTTSLHHALRFLSTDHSAGKRGNIIIYPSGTNMLGSWKTGAARIVVSAIERNIPLNIVFVHLLTHPKDLLPALANSSRQPVAMGISSGPAALELDYLVHQQSNSYQKAQYVSLYLQAAFVRNAHALPSALSQNNMMWNIDWLQYSHILGGNGYNGLDIGGSLSSPVPLFTQDG
jgi:hypothetical protein